jgi:hypothetical protein
LGSVSGGRSAFCCNLPLVQRRGLGSTAVLLAAHREDAKLDKVAARYAGEFQIIQSIST